MGKIDSNDIAAESGAAGLALALDEGESVDIVPTLRNFRPEEIHIGKKSKTVRRVVTLPHIVSQVKSLLGAWPKRVGSLPFFLDKREIKLLDKPEKAFAWIQSRVGLSWGAGLDEDGASLVTKQEFFAHICQSNEFEQYRAAEALPHWPRLPMHFYTWEPPTDYIPDGTYLDALVARFTNVEAEHDRQLLKAMIMAPAWGGPYGGRPCFVLEANDRGAGKTQTANMLGRLYGGYLDFDLSRSGEEDLATRLLSEGGLTKRVVRVDNVKRQAGSGLVENLITSDDVSGKRLFHGEASRPNTLLWVITANGLRMSRDMAERAFIVRFRKLTDAEKALSWRQGTIDLIDNHRDKILADIGAELERATEYDAAISDRWPEFVQAVLSKSFASRESLAAAVKLNQQRRDEHDDDLDEALSIQEAVDVYQADKPSTFVKGCDMVAVVNEALNLSYRLSASKVKHTLKEHLAAGRLVRICEQRSAAARGWRVDPPDDKKTTQGATGRDGGAVQEPPPDLPGLDILPLADMQ